MKMLDRRLFIIFLAGVVLVSVIHAERARYDDLVSEDEEEAMEFANENSNDDAEDVIETIKRFLTKKKSTTTVKPSSDSIAALITTTPIVKVTTKPTSTSTKSSVFGGMFGRKTSSTALPAVSTTTSRYGNTLKTTAPTQDACGAVNPCKNGGTCKTLSSGRYYCFCTQDYYGKTCENKFITSGTANRDRAPTDHCAKSPCLNGGECVGLRTTYYCRCKSPYYGTNCDKRIGKREETMEEFNSFDDELDQYRRDLEEDRDDLRRALAYVDMAEDVE